MTISKVAVSLSSISPYQRFLLRFDPVYPFKTLYKKIDLILRRVSQPRERRTSADCASGFEITGVYL